jgi:uncharacterized protein
MADLVRDLRRPEAYNRILLCHAVDMIETHASWVFLTERDVFKVKKPVNLGFLDFSTVAQRQRACEAEVILNRRLAPEIYIGVIPLCTGEDGAIHAGMPGLIVDWAVHMRRLPEDCRADYLLARGELDIRKVEALAKRVAQFHGAARCDNTTTLFGMPDAIASNVEETVAQTQELISNYLAVDEAKELIAWQRSFLLGNRPLFETRAQNGFVRDGHGDLQLQHVYFTSGEPIVLDCIEFNDRFRFADVCSDVAFLSMDLACHGRKDLADQFLSHYARESNDFGFYGVVDFYLSYWAFVRAKVAAILGADNDADPAARQHASDQARKYFQFALVTVRGATTQTIYRLLQ